MDKTKCKYCETTIFIDQNCMCCEAENDRLFERVAEAEEKREIAEGLTHKLQTVLQIELDKKIVVIEQLAESKRREALLLEAVERVKYWLDRKQTVIVPWEIAMAIENALEAEEVPDDQN